MPDRVIIVGGGHAGVEAATAVARSGVEAILLTARADMVGAMSCNPAIGGIGKGHLVRELDVYGGLLARAADEAAIHYRMLNRSKGPAVRGPRIQADRKRFQHAVRSRVDAQCRLKLHEGQVDHLLIEAGRVTGVSLSSGDVVRGSAVILATGTFLGGRLHFGLSSCDGGRIGEAGAHPLARQLRELGLPIARLKTGTPPRLDGRTVDWAALAPQPSDSAAWTFSPFHSGGKLPQLSCFITRTQAATHQIIRDNLDRSPLFSGAIEGVGPRYCPSIEDKVMRFGDRDGHQIFLEPEGLDDPWIYPNGLSTSLPLDVQESFVRSLPGLSQVRIAQAGYAVEYDHLDPRILDHRLACRPVEGLFCAGQINGTTGYEEAAAQGLVAGINAARFVRGLEPARFDRSDSYIGVMIDDLVLQGVTEPYRMLTSRAEFRLHLRADNAVARLGRHAQALGVVDEVQSAAISNQLIDLDRTRRSLKAHTDVIRQGADRAALLEIDPSLETHDAVLEEAMADVLYEPYVERQRTEQDRVRRDLAISLTKIDDYHTIAGLSNEMIERLQRSQPATLAEAGRVRGITPAALTAILVAASRAA